MLLLTITSPIITATVIFLMDKYRAGFKSHGLLTFAGVALTWILLLYQQLMFREVGEPIGLTFLNMINFPATIRLDNNSWNLAIAFLGLGFLVALIRLLSVTTNMREVYILLGSLSIGSLAIFSGNLITLALLWTIVELTDFLFLWNRFGSQSIGSKVVRITSANLVATLILVSANVISKTSQSNDFFGGLILAALVLRIGVGVFRSNIIAEGDRSIDSNIVGFYLPVVTSLSLLLLVDGSIFPDSSNDFPFYALTVVAIVAAIIWNRSEINQSSEGYWVLSVGSFAIAAASSGYINVSIAWVLVLIYVGGYLSIARQLGRGLLFTNVVVVFGISQLPYSMTYLTNEMIINSTISQAVIIIVWQSIIIAGIFQKMFIGTKGMLSQNRPSGLLRNGGYILLPLLMLGHSWVIYSKSEVSLSGISWWPTVAIIAVSALVYIVRNRNYSIPQMFKGGLESIIRNLTNLGKGVIMGIGRITDSVSAVLEGEGGVLWAILLIVLMATLFFQLSPGF